MRAANRKIDRTESVIFSLWTLFFLFVTFSGRLPLYINPRFVALPIIGAIICGAMAFVYRRGRPANGHSKRDWSLTPWFLMPVAIALIVPPVGLGTFVANNRQGSLTGSGQGNSAISLDLSNDSNYKPVTVIDLADAGNIKGGKVSVQGQLLTRSAKLGANQCLLAHYQMVCCVADVSPVAVILEYPGGYTPTKGKWVQVDGVASRDKRGVILKADAIRPIPTPNPPYLY